MEITHANQKFMTDLALEITSGCRYNCTGCQVEKVDNRFPSPEKFDQLDAYLDSCEAVGIKPYDFSIGPTDIVTASNREEFMSSERVAKVARRFVNAAFNVAFLHPKDEDYVWLAEKIEAMVPGMPVKLVIPFEAAQVNNKAYKDAIARRVKIVMDNLKTCHVYTVYSVINFDAYLTYSKSKEHLNEEILADVHDHRFDGLGDVGQHVDFILPHARGGLEDVLNRSRFIKSLKRLTEILGNTKGMKRYTDANDFGPSLNDNQSHEGTEMDLTYHNGELYFRPFLVDAFTYFHEDLRVKGVWTYANVQNERLDKFVDQLNDSQHWKDCSGCEHASTCATRNVHTVMKIIKTQNCISGVKQRAVEPL